MIYRNANAAINVKVLIIVLLVAAAAGVSLVAARQVRRGVVSETALEVGQTAYDRADWTEAVKHWRIYLGRHPEDVEVLRKYGESLLNIRPPTLTTIAGAMSVYNQLMKLAPQEGVAYETLAMLYAATRQFDSLDRVAQTRLQYAPDDPNASIWRAQALIGREQKPQARQTLESLIAKLKARPEKCRQYAHACILMGGLVDGDRSLSQGRRPAGTQIEDANAPQTPLGWLDLAVAYDAGSVEALVARAQLCRQMAGDGDLKKDEKGALMQRARQDLEAAEALTCGNPRLLYALGGEWVFHGELDRAEAQLKAIDKLSWNVMGEHFFDPNDWRMMRFLFVAELAAKRGGYKETADSIREALESFTEPRHRLQILPVAIQMYLAADRVEDANECLARYVEAYGSCEQTPESSLRLALCRARVAIARDRPYEAIDILRPIVQREKSNPQIWQLCDLLGTACQQTQQTSMAVDAWTQCLQLLQRQARPTEAMVQRAAEIRAQLPAHYARLGDWERILKPMAGSTVTDPNDPGARLLQIEATVNRMAQQGEILDAAQLAALGKELDALRAQDPNNVRVRVFQAALWDHGGQIDRAETELKLAIAECREPLAAEMQLTELYQRTGRRTEAMSMCRQAIERDPQAAEPWNTLSDLQANAGDREAARRCLEEGLQSVNEEASRDSLSLRLARLDLAAKETRSAGIARLMELTEQDPRDVRTRDLLLSLAEIQGDPNVAERLIAELHQVEGEGGLMWRFHRASVRFSSRDWRSKQQEITNLLEYCIEADPRSIPPVLLLGRLYERLGTLRSAESVYRRALAVSPSASEVAERLANLLTFQGRQVEALEVLPNISLVQRPYVSEQAGDLSGAIEHFQRRIGNDWAKADAESRVQLARLLYERTRDTQRALSYLDEARRIDPNSQTQVAARAWILVEEGRASEAFQVLDDFVAGHNTFRAYWMRAVFLAERGEMERAEQDFRKLTTFAGSGAAGYELLANFFATHAKLDQALGAVEEGIKGHPENLRLRHRQLQLLLQRGLPQDRQKAHEVRSALQKEVPDSAELMVYEATEKLENATPEGLTEARQILERAVKLNPLLVNAHLILIDVLSRQGDFQVASEQAARALEANPTSMPLRVARAGTELTLGHGRIAFNLAGQILEDDPNHVDALTIAVNGSLVGKDLRLQEQAATLIDGAIGRIPDNEKLLIVRARIHLAREQPRRAIPELESYCKAESGRSSVPALVMLADLYRNAGDLDEADRTIARAETLAPDRQIIIHARLLLRMAQNRLADLEGVSSAYISAGAQDQTIVLNAASRLMSLNTAESRREALKLFEHAATTWPKSLEARQGFGLALYTMGEIPRAKQVYEALRQEFPGSPQILNDLAWILQEHDHDYEKALELANQGIRVSQGQLDLLESYLHLLDTRATVLKAMNRQAEAKKDYDTVRRLCLPEPELRPRLARTLLALARICVEQGELAEAKQHIASAQEIDGRIGVFTLEERSEITGILQREDGP